MAKSIRRFSVMFIDCTDGEEPEFVHKNVQVQLRKKTGVLRMFYRNPLGESVVDNSFPVEKVRLLDSHVVEVDCLDGSYTFVARKSGENAKLLFADVRAWLDKHTD